jgi:hypothetical protein
MGSKNTHGCAQNAEHKDCDEFLNHIIQVTGDDSWVSLMNVETKEQLKQ